MALTRTNIHIVGLTQTNDLVGAALQAVQQADAIIGSERHLEIVTPHLPTKADNAKEIKPSLNKLPKLAELKPLIDELSLSASNNKLNNQTQSIVVLASGDPLYY